MWWEGRWYEADGSGCDLLVHVCPGRLLGKVGKNHCLYTLCWVTYGCLLTSSHISSHVLIVTAWRSTLTSCLLHSVFNAEWLSYLLGVHAEQELCCTLVIEEHDEECTMSASVRVPTRYVLVSHFFLYRLTGFRKGSRHSKSNAPDVSPCGVSRNCFVRGQH